MLRKLALHIPPIKRLWEHRNSLLSRLNVSGEKGSPFFNYVSSFDAIEVMQRHAAKSLTPSPDHLTNFLGVKISPDFFPGILDGRAGQIEEIPIPANWHADIAEWAAALRAVDLSQEKFRIIELGCGWGCWLNNTGVAARNSGRDVELIGVEGDAGHVEFAHRAMADNGFSNTEYRIIHGIAAPADGRALFPAVERAGATWGSEPLLNATEAQRTEAAATGGYIDLPSFALSSIAHGRPVDLLHIDIQGGEADFVQSTLVDLNSLVRYILVGTHSREIEGRLMAILRNAGWQLEMDRAAIITILDGRPQISVDGVQAWRNPRL
ncbi:FkbM family methyltransferase [Rhizobium sp. Root1220]|uniref:FkbM family methyltransferase n=1 Tax=Rhizobium sp. Root1220 TaxID=1736432 RepID=UPI0006F417F3|nr:FkbM family methyltransferase [Rhizobium sp. Root1220]KQV83974.1 FkbM family methyltransferase [Rhizobium sp. Root1220]